MFKSRIAAAALIAATLASCDKPVAPTAQARPVRTVTVERPAEGEAVSMTGQVRAKDEVSLAFRLDGRMIERPANVGDLVKAGQVVARLDQPNEQNALRSAQANLAAADSHQWNRFSVDGGQGAMATRNVDIDSLLVSPARASM